MITPVLPIMMVIVPGVVIASNSSENVFEENPILFIVTWGIMAAKVTNKLIVSFPECEHWLSSVYTRYFQQVAHMSKSELSNNDIVLVVPAAFFVRSYCHLGGIISEKQLLVLSAAFVTVDLVLYCRAVRALSGTDDPLSDVRTTFLCSSRCAWRFVTT